MCAEKLTRHHHRPSRPTRRRQLTLRGWLYNLRESGKLLFPIFRDGTGVIQGVVSLKESPEAFAALKGLTQESSVVVTGKIQAEPRAPGGYEIHVSGIEVVQRVSDSEPYPIQLKEHGVDFLLDQRHLWIRTPRQAAILRIRAEAERAARNYMDSQGYTLTDAPIFTPAACEGTTTLFEVNYIDEQKAYLTQSGQLYGEATAAASRQGLHVSAPHFAPKNPRRAATSPNSGCSSPKPLTRIWKT